jgi:hypothetical protein
VCAGDDARAFGHVRRHIGHLDDAASIDRHGLHPSAGLGGHELPGHDVGVVLEDR